ncbi:hypothetical protein F4680DRAFT_450538 [Xylaria scruposa]|nr:hypothetical protein F4680DRAFT_450538 [Xylaria scruposa]
MSVAAQHSTARTASWSGASRRRRKAEKEGEQGEGPQKRYMLLDAAAVETMRGASTVLAKRRNRIKHLLSRFLNDCKAAAAELERAGCIAQQNTRTESGCKRPKSEDLDDCKAEPEAKRIKTEADD